MNIQELANLLNEFFNHKSDANKYLTAEQQEDLEKDFEEWVIKNATCILHGKLSSSTDEQCRR